jgi:sorting nexin-13
MLPCSGVQDIFDMLQSPTFVLQLGYGILEICCVNLFPEMKALFRQMEHGVN